MLILRNPYARCVATGVLLVVAACGDEESTSREDADSGALDGGTDARVPGGDGGDTSPEVDGGSSADAASGNTMEADAGCLVTDSCPPIDPLAPFALNCASLPANGVCQGGPHEVLLVTEESGSVLMFEPSDGHFLGYFKRPSANYYLHGYDDYTMFTQGPDQCIWSVSNADELQIERWNTDSAYRDKPLKPHQILLSGQAPDDAVQSPLSIAFTRDRVYVGSEYGDPQSRITRWTLDGEFESVVLEDGTEATSMEVLGDGSLLIADENTYSIIRVPTKGPTQTVFSAGLSWPGQVSYDGDGKALVADISSGEPVHEVELSTGVATTVYPNIQSGSNKYGIKKLGNGHWLLTGGQFGVVSLDPLSKEPVGQYVSVWDDNAIDSANFKQVGRACLSEEFVASRATKPADESCTPPDGAAIFEENFETGDFSGTGSSRSFKGFTDRGTSAVTSSLVAGAGVGGSRALSVAGGAGSGSAGNNTGVHVAIPASTPKYVSFYVNVSSPGHATNPDVSEGFFNLSNAAAVADSDAYTRLIATYTNDGWLYNSNAAAAIDLTKPVAPQTQVDPWIHVEMRNIDWTARTYDLYVNCKRLAAGIGIPAGYGDTIDTLDLYNYDEKSDPAVALYDNILIK